MIRYDELEMYDLGYVRGTYHGDDYREVVSAGDLDNIQDRRLIRAYREGFKRGRAQRINHLGWA